MISYLGEGKEIGRIGERERAKRIIQSIVPHSSTNWGKSSETFIELYSISHCSFNVNFYCSDQSQEDMLKRLFKRHLRCSGKSQPYVCEPYKTRVRFIVKKDKFN